jgi:Ca2+/Na+ antiporter
MGIITTVFLFQAYNKAAKNKGFILTTAILSIFLLLYNFAVIALYPLAVLTILIFVLMIVFIAISLKNNNNAEENEFDSNGANINLSSTKKVAKTDEAESLEK